MYKYKDIVFSRRKLRMNAVEFCGRQDLFDLHRNKADLIWEFVDYLEAREKQRLAAQKEKANEYRRNKRKEKISKRKDSD